MERTFFSAGKRVWMVCGIIMAVGLFTACKKSGNGPANPVSALMVFNVAPDKSAIGVRLSGNSLTQSPIAYGGFTGSYLSIYPGNRTIETFDSAAAFVSTDYSFDQGRYYSLFILGNAGNYSNLVVNDNFDSLSKASGKAYIRYINAVADSSKPSVNVKAGSADIFKDNAAFKSVTAFVPVTPGDINISINNESSINASRTVAVEQGKVYTILLMGSPQATDSVNKVQIRYIQNGGL